jgi:hypothetical protein
MKSSSLLLGLASLLLAPSLSAATESVGKYIVKKRTMNNTCLIYYVEDGHKIPGVRSDHLELFLDRQNPKRKTNAAVLKDWFSDYMNSRKTKFADLSSFNQPDTLDCGDIYKLQEGLTKHLAAARDAEERSEGNEIDLECLSPSEVYKLNFSLLENNELDWNLQTKDENDNFQSWGNEVVRLEATKNKQCPLQITTLNYYSSSDRVQDALKVCLPVQNVTESQFTARVTTMQADRRQFNGIRELNCRTSKAFRESQAFEDALDLLQEQEEKKFKAQRRNSDFELAPDDIDPYDSDSSGDSESEGELI